MSTPISPASSASARELAGGREIIQIGMMVGDIDKAMAQWTSIGVGPFYVCRNVALEGVWFRGQATHVDLTFALAHMGGIQLELMCQHSAEPTAWTLGQEGEIPGGQSIFHHVAFMTDEYDQTMADLAERGIKSSMDIQSRDVRTAYLETRDQLGFLLEIQESRESLNALNTMVEEASKNWDGSDPIRTLNW
ncbi:VOC family protein [Nocardia vinacea]|uniref:VOC family protein n=1 Tax=Nocardia vinacea TaxID=96468 RepID=UPI00030FBA0F|nr:VOC family protein [Nocardia vinacea]